MRTPFAIPINNYWLHLVFMVLLFSPQYILGEHPSIFFATDDIADIRLKTTSSHAAIIKPILSQANSLLSASVTTEPAGAAYSALSLASRDIMVLAFAGMTLICFNSFKQVLVGEKDFKTNFSHV